MQFLVNEGALVSATADDTLHLWNFRQKIPQVVQSLKFQRERYTSRSHSDDCHILTYCYFQDNVHASTVTKQMALRWHRTRKHPRSSHRDIRIVWLRYQLEQSNRSVSMHEMKFSVTYMKKIEIYIKMKRGINPRKFQSAKTIKRNSWLHHYRYISFPRVVSQRFMNACCEKRTKKKLAKATCDTRVIRQKKKKTTKKS